MVIVIAGVLMSQLNGNKMMQNIYRFIFIKRKNNLQ